MMKLSAIGNLGADAQLQVSNGDEYVTFRIAHTQRFTREGRDVEETTWISCSMWGNAGNLLPYLRRGAKVYVEGNVHLRVFSSQKTRRMEAGVNLSVTHVELCGGSTDAVPRSLVTPDGEVVPVQKCFFISEPTHFGKVLSDGNFNTFNVDPNGLVSPYQEPSPEGQQTSGEEVAHESDTGH